MAFEFIVHVNMLQNFLIRTQWNKKKKNKKSFVSNAYFHAGFSPSKI